MRPRNTFWGLVEHLAGYHHHEWHSTTIHSEWEAPTLGHGPFLPKHLAFRTLDGFEKACCWCGKTKVVDIWDDPIDPGKWTKIR